MNSILEHHEGSLLTPDTPHGKIAEDRVHGEVNTDGTQLHPNTTSTV